MVASKMLLLPAFLALAGHLSFTSATPVARADATAACKDIATAIGTANVFYPNSTQYLSDIHHNFGSSSELATCSVDPGTNADVAAVLAVIGKYKVPFAVKSGGHFFARTFSSTTGVQIDLHKFNALKFDTASQTLVVGPGQTWNDVYTALDPFNVHCIGARQPSVGVGGFLTGGGYGWLSNQYGLGIDNILSYDLVQPNGQLVTVTAASKPDLFFALKGGANNFGIVTSFTIKTFTQGTVWGGTFSIAAKDVPALTAEIANFSANVTDPKASMAAYYLGAVGTTDLTMLGFIFYDAPAPPAGLYDKILAIPKVTFDVKARSMLQLIQASASAPFARGLVEQIPVLSFPTGLLASFQSEAVAMAGTMKDAKPVWIGYLVEPFAPGLLTHGVPSTSTFPSSAWPPTRDFSITTSAVWLGWNESSQDAIIQDAARKSAARIAAKAVSLGQKQSDPTFPDTSIYPNYAATWTTAKQLYGSHLPALQKIKTQYDPTNLMGLAGGVKIVGA